MISSDSRYADSDVVVVQNAAGNDVQVIVPSDAESYTFNYVNYLIGGDDRIDNLAYAFYNDVTLWWQIGDANPEITDWGNLVAGTIIRIPNG